MNFYSYEGEVKSGGMALDHKKLFTNFLSDFTEPSIVGYGKFLIHDLLPQIFRGKLNRL